MEVVELEEVRAGEIRAGELKPWPPRVGEAVLAGDHQHVDRGPISSWPGSSPRVRRESIHAANTDLPSPSMPV